MEWICGNGIAEIGGGKKIPSYFHFFFFFKKWYVHTIFIIFL